MLNVTFFQEIKNDQRLSEYDEQTSDYARLCQSVVFGAGWKSLHFPIVSDSEHDEDEKNEKSRENEQGGRVPDVFSVQFFPGLVVGIDVDDDGDQEDEIEEIVRFQLIQFACERIVHSKV